MIALRKHGVDFYKTLERVGMIMRTKQMGSDHFYFYFKMADKKLKGDIDFKDLLQRVLWIL